MEWASGFIVLNSTTQCVDHSLVPLARHWQGTLVCNTSLLARHDDVIKWKHFQRYWPFVRVIHQSPMNYPHKGQWRRALIFSWICAWINSWVNSREAGDLRRHRAHYDAIVMLLVVTEMCCECFKLKNLYHKHDVKLHHFRPFFIWLADKAQDN